MPLCLPSKFFTSHQLLIFPRIQVFCDVILCH